MCIRDSNYDVKQVVSKNDTVNRGSENESVKSVEVSYGALVSVIELEREYEESLNVEGCLLYTSIVCCLNC